MTEDSKGKYVTRSVYQKVCEENKKLLADIKLLTQEEITGERILLSIKWRDKFKKDKEFNDVLVAACKQYLKDHPEFDITKGHSGVLDSNPKAFKN